MDFPIFHIDFLGDRFIVAMIAILHVIINHALAVGMIPLVAYLEHLSVKHNNPKLDKLAYKIMFVAFIITTTIGAMTGVGIWLSTSLISPAGIGSLIRVFYLGWATEWIVFITEVVLIMIYFLTWKKANTSPEAKKKHIRFGVYLSIASWLTMAIIVAILGFMMDTGNWKAQHSLLNGFLNPIYLPQLMFRTPLAIVMAGTLVLLLINLFARKDEATRTTALKSISKIILFVLPVLAAAAYWYYSRIPKLMIGNLQVALATQDFQQWYGMLMKFVWAGIGVTAFMSLLPFVKPGLLPKWSYVIPVLLVFAFAGIFERLREFIRKPYVIGDYMYTNGIRKQDYPLLQKEGILKYATYVEHREITKENKIEAGRDVFMLTCSRCHTTNGVNNVTEKFEMMYGKKGMALQDKSEAMTTYISNMHNARFFMPPFPGTEKEAGALVAYIQHLQKAPGDVITSQTDGIELVNTNENKKTKN